MRGKLCGKIGLLGGRITFGELGRKINVESQCESGDNAICGQQSLDPKSEI